MYNPAWMKSIMSVSSSGNKISIKLRDVCITFQVSGSDLEDALSEQGKLRKLD